MEKDPEGVGSWALVAGAAEGLGEAFSILLAERGMNLIMADISQASLQKLAGELESKHGIQTRPLLLDLAAGDAAERCLAALGELDCRLLVYTAAYSDVIPFLSQTPEALDRFINVNARTVIRLVHAFAGRLKASGRPGGILLVSSLAGLVAPPLLAPYAATKAFNIKLAESLWNELKPFGIRISACVAGVITTPKFWESRPVFGKFKPPMMAPRAVAEYALRKLGTKPAFIPGRMNRLAYFLLLRILPKKMALRMVSGTVGKMYAGRS